MLGTFYLITKGDVIWMYLTFMILTGINLLVYFYSFLKDLQMIIETKPFKKAFEAGKNIGKDIEKTYE